MVIEVIPSTGCFPRNYQQVITISVDDTRKFLLNGILFPTYSRSSILVYCSFNHTINIFLISNLQGKEARASKAFVKHYLCEICKALFTLGRNMISLITNETCFVMKSVHITQCIARIMFETRLF